MNILILMHFADIVDMLIESTLSTLVAWKFRPKYFYIVYEIFSAEFVVELCSSRGSATKTQWQPSSNSVVASAGPVIRYRHKLSNKYICFSKRGRVRVMVSTIITTLFVLRRGAAHTPFGTEEIFHRSLVYSNWRFPGGWSSTEMSNWSNLMQI